MQPGGERCPFFPAKGRQTDGLYLSAISKVANPGSRYRPSSKTGTGNIRHDQNIPQLLHCASHPINDY